MCIRDSTIYAHQANYYDREAVNPHHSMFKYDIAGNAWDTVTGMPVYGMEKGSEDKKKKSKDGACGAWYDGNIYAFKGGNTQSFWMYSAGENAWTQLREDTLPQYTTTTDKKRRVKQGADIVHYGDGVFYALKGNKTRELWRYIAPLAEGGLGVACVGRTGVMAQGTTNVESRMTIFPNPIANGFATMRIRGFKESRNQTASVRLYDVAGRCMLVRSLIIGHSDLVIPLDTRRLSSGVYLVRFDTDSYSTTHKLVIQH